MLVSNIRYLEAGGRCELRARIEGGGLNGAFELCHRFRGRLDGFAAQVHGDPFVAGCLPWAMRTGEALEIRAPVSRRLLGGMANARDIYASFDPSLKPVTIHAPPEVDRPADPARATDVGLFFSLGLDSFYSLLKLTGNGPGHGSRITLITVRGFDIPMDPIRDPLWRTVQQNLGQVERAYGVERIEVESNIREASDRILPWSLYYGAAMASVALAIQPNLGRVYIPGPASYARVHPGGSTPLLDPLWSTERLEFVHDGCEANRPQKAALVSTSAVALETLRVCTVNPDGVYNCGRCEKCIRTMICLHMAGGLARCGTLPQDLSTAAIRNLRIQTRDEFSRYEEIMAALGAPERDAWLREALAFALFKGRAAAAWNAYCRTRGAARTRWLTAALQWGLPRAGRLLR